MAVSADDIRNAAEILDGQIIRTPFVAAPMMSRHLGCEVMLKLENLQHTSSFKARGAFMAMQALDAGARKRGVITMSAGNHAQAVAYLDMAGNTKSSTVVFAAISRHLFAFDDFKRFSHGVRGPLLDGGCGRRPRIRPPGVTGNAVAKSNRPLGTSACGGAPRDCRSPMTTG